MGLDEIFGNPEDKFLAEDILKALEPRRLILYGRNSEKFVQRMEKHYTEKHKKLVNVIDALLKWDLGELKHTLLIDTKKDVTEMTFEVGNLNIENFPNKEQFLKSNSNIRGKHIDLVYLFDDPDKGMMELFIAGDLLRRAGAVGVDLYLPFIPYQREDKKDEGRVPITAKLVFDLIDTAYGDLLKRIVTMDLHAGQAQGFVNKPVDHLYFLGTFCDYVLSKEFREKHPGEFLAASLDAGRAKNAHRLSKLLKIDYVVMDKKRTAHGECEVKDNKDLDRIEGKNIIAIEDMIDTGGTNENAYNEFERYGAKSVTIGACHGILSPKKASTAEEKLRKCKNLHIVISDSIPKPEGYYEQNKDLITAISISKKFADVLLTNRLNFSVSSLIERHKTRIRDVVERKREYTSVDDILLT